MAGICQEFSNFALKNEHMKYSEFEDIISQQRMSKYLLACNNDSKKAMTLYRYNLKLSQEMFSLISCF